MDAVTADALGRDRRGVARGPAAAALGDLERAATLHGVAAAMLERAGGQWPPDEREQYDETFATLAAGLPPDALAAARSRGAVMSVTDGVAYALRASSG